MGATITLTSMEAGTADRIARVVALPPMPALFIASANENEMPHKIWGWEI